MSKPLELTIYPPLAKQPLPFDPDWQGWDAWREWKRLYDREFQQRRDARLKEAELCAEYESARCDAMIQSATGRCWAPLFDTWPMDPESIHNRARTLLRFATHPHYFEATESESDTE